MITLNFSNSVATYTSPSQTVSVKVNSSDHKDKMIDKAKANAIKAGLEFAITGELPNHYILYNAQMDTGIEYETCPVHKNIVRKVYTFGRYEDAEVVTYQGCDCAVCVKHEDMDSDATYHTSYSSASSRASYIKQSFNVYYRM